jgi:hypothetical protein
VLAFVMLTGRHPFATTDLRALVAAHAFERVPSPSAVAPELAAWPRLVDFVARATEKDRARRAASAAELRALLDGADVPVRATGRRDAAPPRETPRATRASFLGIPSAAVPSTVNLTLVHVRIARSPHDALLLPVVRAFGGRRLGYDAGGALFAFRSPTDAVACAAAMQDEAARAEVPPAWTKGLAVGVHQGELRFEREGAVGAPLETVRAVSACAAPGEVWLTRAVFLTMTRSEAPSEEMGPRAVEGEAAPIDLYRLVRGRGALPYGGSHLSRVGTRRSRLLALLRPNPASRPTSR